MRREPYVLKPRDIEVRPERGGLSVAFSGERQHLRVEARMVEDALSRAFDGHKIRLQASERGRHSLHIAGLDMEQERRVRMVLNAAHIFHTAGDDECPDLCLALDWQVEPLKEGGFKRTRTGEIEYRAKWGRDAVAIREAIWMLHTLARAHGDLSAAACIVAPPSRYGLVSQLANGLGEQLGIPVLKATKTKGIPSQSDSGERDFDALCERQIGTISVQADALSGSALIVDDLYYSGGTIRALTSALRMLGAERILALTVTKSLKHHRQT